MTSRKQSEEIEEKNGNERGSSTFIMVVAGTVIAGVAGILYK